MKVIEIGIRELQRGTSGVIERIETEGAHVIVSRQRQPVALLVPVAHAHAWTLANRPLGDDPDDDETFWPVEDGVRLAPAAAEPLAALPDQLRVRLFARLRKLRGFHATGRIVLRLGQVYAFAELDGPAEPILLAVARRAALQPM